MASVDVFGMEKTDVSGSSLYCLPRRSPIQENLPHSGQTVWHMVPPAPHQCIYVSEESYMVPEKEESGWTTQIACSYWQPPPS